MLTLLTIILTATWLWIARAFAHRVTIRRQILDRLLELGRVERW